MYLNCFSFFKLFNIDLVYNEAVLQYFITNKKEIQRHHIAISLRRMKQHVGRKIQNIFR